MKRSFSLFAGNKVFLCFLLAGFFALASVSNTNAQESATNGANPYSSIAQQLGVTAYPLQTFDPAEAVALLQQLTEELEPIVANGGGTTEQKARYAYLSAVWNDAYKYSIASEISLLNRSSVFTRMNSSQSTYLQGNQSVNLLLFRNIYNEIVSQLL